MLHTDGIEHHLMVDNAEWLYVAVPQWNIVD
jgi:hypothetical protein